MSQILSSPLTTINQCFLRTTKTYITVFWNGGSYYLLTEILPREFKVNNRKTKNTRAWFEMCLHLSVKTPEWRHWLCSGFFIANFQQILHNHLVFLSMTLRESKCWLSRWIIEWNLIWTRSLTLAYLDTSISPPEFVNFNWLAIPN